MFGIGKQSCTCPVGVSLRQFSAYWTDGVIIGTYSNSVVFEESNFRYVVGIGIVAYVLLQVPRRCQYTIDE
jgi:hypothetical protein